MTPKPNLDSLLAASLKPVEDRGFSQSVVATIAARERAWMGVEIGMAVGVFAAIVAFTPAAAIVGPVEKMAVDLSTSVPFAIGCAALVLTFVGLRWFADET
jgi:hypothetical protein